MLTFILRGYEILPIIWFFRILDDEREDEAAPQRRLCRPISKTRLLKQKSEPDILVALLLLRFRGTLPCPCSEKASGRLQINRKFSRK
jgi:hypothetical protein